MLFLMRKWLVLMKVKKLFYWHRQKKKKYDKLFVAVGGYSYDRIKGINKSLLDSLMVKYNLFEPVLCPLKTKEKIPEYLVGARAFATVKLLENDKEIYCENGEILFKKDGISGISILIHRYTLIQILIKNIKF